MPADVTIKDLEFLSELIEAVKVRPVIDRCYPFAEIPATIAPTLETGTRDGKGGRGSGLRDLPQFAVHPLAAFPRHYLVVIEIGLPRVGAFTLPHVSMIVNRHRIDAFRAFLDCAV